MEAAIPFSLVPTPVLELILEKENNELAIEEYQRLREIHCHLASHLVAIKQQTDASVAAIASLGQVEPSAPANLTRS